MTMLIIFALAMSPQAASKSANTICSRLADDYENVDKSLSANYAAGVADNSAPRATLRAQRDANEWAKAHLTVELMRAHSCPMPKRTPSAVGYMLAALTCERASIRNPEAPECVMANWKRSEETEK